jgi:hypothetical protein
MPAISTSGYNCNAAPVVSASPVGGEIDLRPLLEEPPRTGWCTSSRGTTPWLGERGPKLTADSGAADSLAAPTFIHEMIAAGGE